MFWNIGIACVAYIWSGLMFMGSLTADPLPTIDIAGKDAARLANIAEFASTESAVAIDDVMALDFQVLSTGDIGQGLTNHTYWLRFSVVTPVTRRSDGFYMATIVIWMYCTFIIATASPCRTLNRQRLSTNNI